MFALAMGGVVVTLLLAIGRAWRGPSVFDRLVAVNMIGTKTVLLIAVSGFLLGRPEWLDLALMYTLANFIGTVAVCRFARFGTLDEEPIARTETEPTEVQQ